jgi:hypothetical protein
MAHFLVQDSECGGLVIRPQLQEIGLAATLAPGLHPVYNLSCRIPARKINLETLVIFQAVSTLYLLMTHIGTTFFLFLVINIGLFHRLSTKNSHFAKES